MFFLTPIDPQGISSLGGTDTFIPVYSADCFAITAAENSSIVPKVIFGVSEVFAITTAENSAVEIYGYGIRESYSITTPESCELDLDLKTNEILFYNPAFE